MQKFILFVLALGLAFFLYLLQNGYISNEDFSINKFKNNTGFIIRKNLDIPDSRINRSDIYVTVNNKEYKIFSFEGDDFNTLYKYQYTDPKYKIPIEANDAVTGVWIGNRYIFYIIKKDNTYEVYKAEYPTDSPDKLEYFKIKVIEETEYTNKIEIKY